MKKLILITTVVLAVITASTMLVAFEGPELPGKPGKGGLHALSVEKEMEVHKAKRTAFDRTQPIHKEMWEIGKGMKDIFLAETIDETKINEIRKEMSEKKQEIQKIKIEEAIKLSKKLDRKEFKMVAGMFIMGPQGHGMKKGKKGPGKGHGMGMGAGKGMALHKLPFDVEMTVHLTQRTIFDKSKDIFPEMMKEGKQLHKLMAARTIDEDKVYEQLDKINALSEELQNIRHEEHMKLLKSLPLEQRKVVMKSFMGMGGRKGGHKDGKRGHKGNGPRNNDKDVENEG